MSIVTDSALRAMLEQLHEAISDGNSSAKVWIFGNDGKPKPEDFDNMSVGDVICLGEGMPVGIVLSHYNSLLYCLVSFMNSLMFAGFSLDNGVVTETVNSGVLTTEAEEYKSLLSDTSSLKNKVSKTYSSVTGSNFSGIKVGDVITSPNSMVFLKSTTIIYAIAADSVIYKYTLSGGSVSRTTTTFATTSSLSSYVTKTAVTSLLEAKAEQSSVDTLKSSVDGVVTKVDGKWDKPVTYGNSNPITADNFNDVKPGDYYMGTMCVKGANGGNELHFAGGGAYRKAFLENGNVRDEYAVVATTTQLNAKQDKQGVYSSLNASNFADVKVGDKVINGICIYKTSVACVVYTGYQKLIQYELANGVVTPYEMTLPEKGEVAALKTAVNGKWDKPVSYGDAKPITKDNFNSVKPGDYYYGTMCVKGANGGTELHFAGAGAYRKEILQSDGTIKSEYAVLATTSQVNAKADKTAVETLKTEVANRTEVLDLDELDTMGGQSASEVIKYRLASKTLPNRFTVKSGNFSVGVLDVFSDNMSHLITQVLETHCIVEDGKITSAHDDNKIFRYYRSYNMNSTSLTGVASGSWSEWKEYRPLAGENVRFQKVFTDADKTSIFDAEVGDVVSGANEGLSGIVLYCDGYNTLKMYTGQGIKVAKRNGTSVTWTSQG